jgi:hypothetical protein
LVIEKEIKQENNKEDEKSKSTKRRKSQSNYTNWFATHIWPSIFVTMKKHDDFIGVFCYLKTFHRKIRKVSGLYEKLRWGSIYKWFTPKGKLEPHLNKAITRGITSIPIHF